MGRLEDSDVAWMEKQLAAKVKEGIASVDPETLPTQQGQLMRALREHCEAAGEEQGIRGQVGDLSVRGLEVLDPETHRAQFEAKVAEKRARAEGARAAREAEVEAQVEASGGDEPMREFSLEEKLENARHRLDNAQQCLANPAELEPGDEEVWKAEMEAARREIAALEAQRGAQGPGLPNLTLEQYASLCVDRQMYPGQEAAIAPRYHVASPQALQLLDQQWHTRLAGDPALHQRFQQACAHYHAWLRQQSGGG